MDTPGSTRSSASAPSDPRETEEDVSSGKDPDSERIDWLLREMARPSLLREPEGVHLKFPGEDTIVAGKYRILRRLGSGGMGVVLEAQHVDSRKTVAVKWMPPDKGGFPARLLAEARAVARIRHPNVVDVYDIASDPDGAYLVMELLAGETLAERMTRGRLPEKELIDIGIQALRGVQAAHQRGVIHRDLKPENIFLTAPATPDAKIEVKVLDFGICKIVAATSSGARLTSEGAFLGTPAFMSPEQLRDPSRVDARSDIYSMGVVLFEALTGRLPFDASGRDALFLAIAEHRMKSIRDVLPGVSRRTADAVMRAMAADPDDRHPDAAAFIQALEATGRSEHPSFGTRFRALIALSAVSLVGAGVFIGVTSRSGSERKPVIAITKSHEEPKSRMSLAVVAPNPKPASSPVAEGDPPEVRLPSGEPSGEPQTSGPVTKPRREPSPSPTARRDPLVARRAGELRIEDF